MPGLLRDHILRMPMGAGDDAAGGFDAAQVAQAALEGIEIQEKQKQIEIEIAEALGNKLEAAKQLLEIERIRYGAAINSLKEQQKLMKENGKTEVELQELLDKTLENMKLTAEQQAEMQDLRNQEATSLDDIIEKLEQFRSKQEISRDFARDIGSMTGTLARNMGIAADFSKTAAGKFAEIGQKFLSGDRAANMRTIFSSIEGLLSPMNILASLFDIAIKKMIALDKAAVGLRVATGFARDFQGEMTAVAASTAQVGVTLEKSNEAFGAIVKTIKGINDQSEQFRKNLADSAAKMTKLGVSADTSAKNFNLLIKSFKMTDTESTAMMESMAAKASDLGLTAEEMGTEFNSAMGYLSSFGKEGIKAFEDLAAQAGTTGLAISKMLDMTKAFDKFSDGAKKAATLNSVLGTSLSSMALMTMNPAQRMTELRNQINAATGGVKNMTQAQKLFTAEAMGYSSVAEMMADLQASPTELAERAALAKRQAEIQERLANAMTELLPLTERVSMAFEKLASNGPLIKRLGNVIEGLINFVVVLIELNQILIPLYAAVKFYLAATALAAKQNAVNFAAMKSAYFGVAGAILLLAIQVENPVIRTGLFALAGGIFALGFASQLSAGKLNLLVTAFAVIAGILGMQINPLFINFGFHMAIGILAMGIAAKIGGIYLIGFTLALALVFGAVALVIYGISAVIDSITGLFTVLIESVDVLPILALNMYLLGSAFLFLGASAMYGSMGIFMGLAGLTAMFLLFKLTGTSMKDMFGAGEEILKIGTGIEKFGQGLGNIGTAVGAIKSSLGDKGLFAGSISGDSTSLVMGDGVAVAKLFKNSKIEVDVKIPEIAIPPINIVVKIGETELKKMINDEITRGQK